MCLVVLHGVGFDRLFQNKQSIDDWRDSVAVYQALNTEETLNHLPSKDDTSTSTATRLSQLSGISITVPDMREQQLQFKRGQILKFDQTPLVQLAYLHSNGTPVAICYFQQNLPNSTVQSDVRYELTTASWTQDKVSMMVIGKLPENTINSIASSLRKNDG
ncbi:MAG: hypothetical protein V3U65_16575 [Granulosicoccaceae bacterium]